MKFFSWLGVIFILLLIIAAITAPGDQKFRDFINKDKGGDTMSCKPVFGKSTKVKLFVNILSIHTVSYCEQNKDLGPVFSIGAQYQPDSIKVSSKIGVIKITGTKTYLGLFGRFWKL